MKKKGALICAALSFVLLICLPVQTYAAFSPTGYLWLPKTYRNREPFLENKKDDSGRSLSAAGDHGDYIEVTNMCAYVYDKYAADEVESKAVGDTMVVAGKSFEIRSKDGNEIVLERKDPYGYSEFEYLEKKTASGSSGKDFYIAVSKGASDGSFDDVTAMYTGSMRFSKDCLCYSYAVEEDGSRKFVPIADYIGTDASLLPGQFHYGLVQNEGTLSFRGTYETDADGIITSYTEKYVP